MAGGLELVGVEFFRGSAKRSDIERMPQGSSKSDDPNVTAKRALDQIIAKHTIPNP